MLRPMTATARLYILPDAPVPDEPPAIPASHRPPVRGGLRRPRLLAPLLDPQGPPFVLAVAPAGYGKTTLLCDWAARDPRPFGWVTLHRGHDGAGALLRAVTNAVDSATAEAPDGRFVLVLDGVQELRSRAARQIVASLAVQPPAGMTVAFTSRTEPPIPVARLRMQGQLTELRPEDLAMTRSEAAAMLRCAGLSLARPEIDALMRRTEGWPAGLALAARAGGPPGRFRGADRHVADYVREEVLAPLPGDEYDFVLRTAVLDVLSAPLCDTLLERGDSAELLARLRRAGFPLVALDHTADRYRHHRLLAEMLRAELRRTDPALAADLHRRASDWHARAGDRARAFRHALAANEPSRAAEIVWSGVPQAVEQGSSTAVEHSLACFSEGQIAGHARLALAAAGVELARGRGDVAEHWLLAAEHHGGVAGEVAALRAALGRDGLAQVQADSARAAARLAPASPGLALCALLAGVAAHLRGDGRAARRHLEDGARRATVPAPQLHALCLAQLALLALDEHDGEEAARLSARAGAQLSRHGLRRFPTSALVLAVTALVRAQRGRVDEAAADAREAAALLEQLIDLPPWYELEVQLALARTALRLSDVNAARARLAAARRLAARVPEALVAQSWLHATERAIARLVRAPAVPLTAAELRILHFLPTHLSFREIAESTSVSANTVKTQANSVYRKLDVRSRSEAVAQARTLGLLEAGS
jgi:LuxR family maltose regulon positive regulatory protein